MNGLAPAPASIVDERGEPRLGTFTGTPERLELSRLTAVRELGPVTRLAREKRWLYTLLATPELAACVAVVDTGYACNAFAMAVALRTGEVLVDRSLVGPPRPAVHVAPALGPRHRAELRLPAARVSSRGTGSGFRLGVRLGAPLPRPALRVEAGLSGAASTPITVVAPVERGVVNVTQKWAGLPTSGTLTAGARRFSLDGGVGGVDLTVGVLARRTAWRWAFVCGRLPDGRTVGVNLVDGFNDTGPGPGENVVWVDGVPTPVGRPTFRWNHDDPLDRWHVTTRCGTVNLTLSPVAVHREHRDLVVVRSRFVQPMGLWTGTLLLPGETVVLTAPGVAEDQRAIW